MSFLWGNLCISGRFLLTIKFLINYARQSVKPLGKMLVLLPENYRWACHGGGGAKKIPGLHSRKRFQSFGFLCHGLADVGLSNKTQRSIEPWPLKQIVRDQNLQSTKFGKRAPFNWANIDQLHILRMRNVGHVEIGFKRNVTHLKYLKVASRIRTQIVGVECKNPDH